ncbi:hypothetical protein [Bifidobacterium tibiigranuli]|uniref:hypothetical protein n=1 Tax=Bifidobacterium tibiigranuli TaxID=2172043 RepID=UPI0023522AAD|nr:hypothetical protein [Bifidobacterium tibiigranuli]MCH3975172.1 hypothetical protein [Bifidobacterium tibiigranuli]
MTPSKRWEVGEISLCRLTHQPSQDQQTISDLRFAYVTPSCRAPALETLPASLYEQQTSSVRRKGSRLDSLGILLRVSESRRHYDLVLKAVVYCSGSAQQEISMVLGVQVQDIRAVLHNADMSIGERNATFNEEQASGRPIIASCERWV